MLKRMLLVVLMLVLFGCGGGGGDDTGSLRVTNSQAVTIYHLHLSPTTSSTWGPDQLGTRTIAYGESFTVTGIPAGTYDMKLDFYDGTYITRYGITISAGQTRAYTITAKGVAKTPVDNAAAVIDKNSLPQDGDNAKGAALAQNPDLLVSEE